MALDYKDIAARQPELSYVAPQGFFMTINKIPQVVYNLQTVTIPTISGTEAPLQNPINPNSAFIPGDSLDYGQLDCGFIIDKDWRTYRSILDWTKGILKPDGYSQYSEWVEEARDDPDLRDEFARTMSDIRVFATDAANTPTAEWVFKNAFPISLDGPAFEATAQDVEYLQANVTFRFMYFEHITYTGGASNHNNI